MCTVPLPKVSVASSGSLAFASSGSLASRSFEVGDRREPIFFRKALLHKKINVKLSPA